MEFQIKLPIAALALAASFGASATSLDFTGGAGFDSQGQMSVTGGRNGRDANITMNNGGLGVKGGVNHFQSIGNETMTFSFSESVTLNSLTFDANTWHDWSGKDQFRYTDDKGNNELLSASSNIFTMGAVGITWFTLEAKGSWTSTFVSGLDVSAVSAVPVPAAAWMFGSALLGLAGISRRQRR